MLENPDLIVASIEALDAQAKGGGLAEEIAKAERDLQKVQMEEDRAIRLFVSGKITEKQLDHQRRFITERLETLRAKLDDHRARESAQAEKRALAEHVVEWSRRASGRLDGLSDEDRREVLELLLDGATIDRHNSINLTLAIPTEDVVSIAEPNTTTASTSCGRRPAAHGASARPGQTRPVKVVFMAYRGTLQADALKLVAKKLQSSLAVEGELPEDGLAAYGDDGDDIMLALARKIVNGEEEEQEGIGGGSLRPGKGRRGGLRGAAGGRGVARRGGGGRA